MGISVYANGQGFFHKGSGGTGKAYPDVCLSPPPPPAGPVPIPYPNSLTASDLADGSKTVKIDGEPTGLEDASYISTSTGDEGGTQGGGVVSHKTKGTGCFTFWSLDIKVEGKGVDRHEDPILQNCGSRTPPNGLTPKARLEAAEALTPTLPCCPPKKKAYKRSDWISESSTDEQKAKANKPVAKCWECKCPGARGWKRPPKKGPPPVPGIMNGNPPKGSGKAKKNFVADHDPPLIIRHYAGGCHDDAATRKADAEDPAGIKTHCTKCSSKQGNALGKHGHHPALKAAHGC